MNNIIEEKINDINKITNKFYKDYKLNRFYEFGDVVNECVVYILQTLKYYDKNKSPINRFLYLQIKNKCLRLLENTLQPSKLVNYDNSLKFNNNTQKFDNNDINFIDELLVDNINLVNDYESKDNIINIITTFKDDELKTNIIKLILMGYKRNEISSILNIKNKQFDYQRKLIREKIIKIYN